MFPMVYGVVAAAGSSVAPIAPDEVISATGVRWHDIAEAYEDAGGTDACEDADPIRNWPDQFGNVNMVRDSVNAPTYDADAGPTGGAAASTASGTKCSGWSTGFTLTTFHVFWVINLDTAGTFARLLNNGSGNSLFRHAEDGQLNIEDESSDSQTTGGVFIDDTYILLEVAYDATTLEIFVNGSSVGTQSRSAQTFTFDQFLHTGFGAIPIAVTPEIVVFDDQLSAGEAAGVRAYLNDKYGGLY